MSEIEITAMEIAIMAIEDPTMREKIADTLDLSDEELDRVLAILKGESND